MIDRPAEPRTYKSLLITDGRIQKIDLRADGHGARHTHELIGDTFVSCFHIPIGGRRVLVGYCDDNFLRKPHLPLNVILTRDLYRHPEPGYPILGPIVVSACVGEDTVSMMEHERNGFHVVGPLLHFSKDGWMK